MDLQTNLFLTHQAAVIQNAPHEVVHPVGTINPADKGGAAFGHRGTGCAHPIDRGIHQGAGLDVLPVFLHQLDLARQGGLILIPRRFHGRAAHRLGEHVVAEGAQVPIDKGFEENNRGIDLPLALRPHPVLGKTLGTNRAHMCVQLRSGHPHGKANALNAGQLLAHILACGEFMPLLAGDAVGVGKKRRAAAQDLLVGAEPLLDAGLDSLTIKIKRQLRLCLIHGFDPPYQPTRNAQAHHEQ